MSFALNITLDKDFVDPDGDLDDGMQDFLRTYQRMQEAADKGEKGGILAQIWFEPSDHPDDLGTIMIEGDFIEAEPARRVRAIIVESRSKLVSTDTSSTGEKG